ncbi:TolB family protein [Mycolicibacterium austroafricanum]|uniref:TolB family protein n=1 Tax=Mycolicibacterium austroafricanum TaxID=39687 RepID=UPI001F23F41C|nr:hypothetical protein [Mycolicibacterium austroafricanum]
MLAPPALFYSKAGSLYISDPAGTPGRKLTDGPADTEPAPSPDLAHVAFVREANASDYGGELWVLDLSPEREPDGPPRRLVDPAALPSIFGDTEVGDEPSRIVSPRWSPTGDQVAFLQAGEGGGFLFVADAVSGEIVSTEQRLFADAGYAWAPDGQHIAWTGGRSDVSPVDVNVLAVGGNSTSVVKDTNAFSVTYGDGGQTVLFANGDASGELFADIPFALRGGGVYSVATPGAMPIDPPAAPTSLFTGQAMFGDVAFLESGAVAFTETRADGDSKTIEVLDAPPSLPRTTIADVAADSPGPVWGRGDVLAYVDAAPSRPLIVTDSENRTPEPIDTGVDAFAWPPQPR